MGRAARSTCAKEMTPCRDCWWRDRKPPVPKHGTQQSHTQTQQRDSSRIQCQGQDTGVPYRVLPPPVPRQRHSSHIHSSRMLHMASAGAETYVPGI